MQRLTARNAFGTSGTRVCRERFRWCRPDSARRTSAALCLAVLLRPALLPPHSPHLGDGRDVLGLGLRDEQWCAVEQRKLGAERRRASRDVQSTCGEPSAKVGALLRDSTCDQNRVGGASWVLAAQGDADHRPGGVVGLGGSGAARAARSTCTRSAACFSTRRRDRPFDGKGRCCTTAARQPQGRRVGSRPSATPLPGRERQPPVVPRLRGLDGAAYPSSGCPRPASAAAPPARSSPPLRPTASGDHRGRGRAHGQGRGAARWAASRRGHADRRDSSRCSGGVCGSRCASTAPSHSECRAATDARTSTRATPTRWSTTPPSRTQARSQDD